jgi:hypothetical protein
MDDELAQAVTVAVTEDDQLIADLKSIIRESLVETRQIIRNGTVAQKLPLLRALNTAAAKGLGAEGEDAIITQLREEQRAFFSMVREALIRGGRPDVANAIEMPPVDGE